MNYQTISEGIERDITLVPDKSLAIVDDTEIPFTFTHAADGRYLLSIGRKVFAIDEVRFNKKKVEFLIDGIWQQITVHDEQDLLMEKMGFKTADEINEGKLIAPMPGKILELMHEPGDSVELGEPVAILEAMKMENELKAPIPGTIDTISVEVGQNVEKNEAILEIKAIG